jgi:N-acyl-D-aspartate/D-glutamate deacylase
MPELDLLVRGGTVVDGSGLPAYTADVGVRDGHIVAIGRLGHAAAAQRMIDADGCVVAPGFVDIHTHYDAQLHFEPTASPSSWHGVTTVITGNCGFSLFPARPDDVGWLCDMLSRVEGMSPATLAEGVDFAGGGMHDFASGIDGRIGVNVGLQVGHCALRRYVLGDDAGTRTATAPEVEAMQVLLRAALDEGAVGFSSSQLDLHVDQHGNPVPSNLAAPDELVALASVFADRAHGVIEFISRSNLEGHDDADRALMLAMCEAAGKPMNVNPIVNLPMLGDGWKRGLEFVDEARAAGHRVHPQSRRAAEGSERARPPARRARAHRGPHAGVLVGSREGGARRRAPRVGRRDRRRARAPAWRRSVRRVPRRVAGRAAPHHVHAGRLARRRVAPHDRGGGASSGEPPR